MKPSHKHTTMTNPKRSRIASTSRLVRRLALLAVVALLISLGLNSKPMRVVRAATVTVTAGPDVDAANNDYRRIQNAINAAVTGDTIMLSGTFDFTQPFAAAAWALGNDNTASTADDYEVLVPTGVNNVTITASSLGAATIQGPGDLAAVNLEGVFVFDGGPNQGWTISNIRFVEFDLSIGFFATPVNAFNNTKIINNYIKIAQDLNSTVAPADVNQNIGIHFSYGTNQMISGNTIEFDGDGVSDSANSNSSTQVGMQSTTSGGNVYDGLQITNNILRVLRAQSADPEVILGIWENAHGHTSNITVSGNQFINLAVGNNPTTNLQLAFRVTSHSSPTTTVKYQSNSMSGASIGFQWIAGSNFTGNQPVQLISNNILNNATGVLVQSQGLANLTFNRIVGNTVGGLNNVDGTVTAENNWWGCNAGPGNAGCDAVTGVADFNPWLVLRLTAAPGTIVVGGTSALTADLTFNSDNVDTHLSGNIPDATSVAFAGNAFGNVGPSSTSTTSGKAGSTYSGTAPGTGNVSTTVDGQTVTTPITVNPNPCGITCPANITKSNDLNQCGAVATYAAPTTTGACGTVNCSPASGSFFSKGVNTVTCTATGGPSCTFTVTVNDTQPPVITCPANITAKTATINDSCAVATFAPGALDNCPGVTVACNPPTGSCFPVGTATVTCTATDGSSNTATCNFTVTVSNLCLQDDSNPASVFSGNTTTGAYTFCCGGTTFTGIAQITRRGNVVTFTHNVGDRRVTATIDGGQFKGTASLQSPPGTTRCTILDRDTRNNSCVCR
jgi:hypothetical protein